MSAAPHVDRRRVVLAKLGEVARKLEAILSGQEVTLADIQLPQERDPAETPLERLRAFQALLQRTLEALRRGEVRTCERCGGRVPDAALDETPWATACGRC